MTCGRCGCPFGVPVALAEAQEANGGIVFCPNGHVLGQQSAEAQPVAEEPPQHPRRARQPRKAPARKVARKGSPAAGRLSEPQQRLLGAAVADSEGLTVAKAAAVLGVGEEEARAELKRLRARHLLHTEGGGRYTATQRGRARVASQSPVSSPAEATTH